MIVNLVINVSVQKLTPVFENGIIMHYNASQKINAITERKIEMN